MSILDSICEISFASEAEVENRLVLPLLELLGYDARDIRPKYPVKTGVGRRRDRNPEADFVVFAGPERSRNTSLLVVEAKNPSELLVEGQGAR